MVWWFFDDCCDSINDFLYSERQGKAETAGDRMKEGIVINQSLTTLGRVIKALHDQQAKGKKSATQVEFFHIYTWKIDCWASKWDNKN